MKKILIATAICLSLASSISINAANYNDQLFDYEKKARLGDEQMQYKLGLIFEFGIKTRKERNEARSWYLKADKQGVIRATTRLGVMAYEDKEYSEALKYLKKAALQNEPLSIVYLGKNALRLNNIEEAESFFKKAMESGNSQAYYEYGILEGDYRKNNYLGYIYTKLSEVNGYSNSVEKNKEYKKGLSSTQIYSANDRIKRTQNLLNNK